MAYKGLTVNIYRTAGYNCTNGGASATADRAIVIGPGIPEIFEAKDSEVVYMLTPSNLRGAAPHLVQVQPAPNGGKGGWSMFGGNYAGTSDSRLGEACKAIMEGAGRGVKVVIGPNILSIHDRYEN